MTGDDDETFMTRSLNVTPKTNRTEFNCTFGKFEAEVTIKDCARAIALLKLTTDRHEALRDLSATAELLVRTSKNSTKRLKPLLKNVC